MLEIRDDFRKAEDAHGDRDEADAVGQFRNIEAEARHARVDVGANQSQQQPEHDHRDGLDKRARGQHDRADQTEHHQREVLCGAELESQLHHR